MKELVVGSSFVTESESKQISESYPMALGLPSVLVPFPDSIESSFLHRLVVRRSCPRALYTRTFTEGRRPPSFTLAQPTIPSFSHPGTAAALQSVAPPQALRPHPSPPALPSPSLADTLSWNLPRFHRSCLIAKIINTSRSPPATSPAVPPFNPSMGSLACTRFTHSLATCSRPLSNSEVPCLCHPSCHRSRSPSSRPPGAG